MSNNVGIDFTELGPSSGQQTNTGRPKGQGVEKQEELITIGFRVKPKEKAITQDYVNRMYNQFLVPSRSEYKRTIMLDYPFSELLHMSQFSCSCSEELFRNHHLMSETFLFRNWQVASKTK